MGKIQNRYFCFKTRFGPLRIDSDHKNCFEKFSFFWSSSFRKNGYVPEKIQREKISKIDIIVLKHGLDHSNSIPAKNIFENFFDFLVFLAIFGPKKSIFWIFGPKKSIFWIFGEEFCKFFLFISKGLYYGYFALLHASLRLSSSAGSLDLSNFWPKWPKNRSFSKILARKNNFEKIFCTLF